MLKAVLLLLTSAAPAHPCRESGCLSHYPLKCFIAYVKALGSSEFGPNFRIMMPLKGKVMGCYLKITLTIRRQIKNIYLFMKSELDGTAGKRMNRKKNKKQKKTRTKKQTNQPQIYLEFKWCEKPFFFLWMVQLARGQTFPWLPTQSLLLGGAHIHFGGCYEEEQFTREWSDRK